MTSRGHGKYSGPILWAALWLGGLLLNQGFMQAPTDSALQGQGRPVPGELSTKAVQVSFREKAQVAAEHKLSPYIFGSNYWHPWHPDFDTLQTRIKHAAINILRYGGHTPDTFVLTHDQVDRFIQHCRAVGATPFMQVPLHGGSSAAAAELVRYANIEKSYNIRFWSVGNEPDLYEDVWHWGPYSVQDYVRDFREYASAMKAVDPSIQIGGPELAWQYIPGSRFNWLTPFLEGCGEIVDFIAIHRYPFSGNQGVAASLADPEKIEPLIDSLRQEIARITQREIPLAITETNLTWNWKAVGEGSAASFFAGLWWAETLGHFMKKSMFMANIWSLVADGSISLFAPVTREPRPTFYVMDFYSHFKDTFIPANSNRKKLVAFASRDSVGDELAVMVLNKAETETFATEIYFADTTAVGDAEPARIGILAGREVYANFLFPPYSLTLLEISFSGAERYFYRYSRAMFDRGEPPESGAWQVTGITVGSAPATPTHGFELLQNFPNPFNPNTRIEYVLPATAPVVLSIYNARGQLIRTLVSRVEGAGKQAVVWQGRDDRGQKVPAGVYFIKMVTGQFTQTRKLIFLP